MSKTVLDFLVRMEKVHWLRMIVLVGPGALITLCVWRFSLGELAGMTAALVTAMGLAAYYSWPRIFARLAPSPENSGIADEIPSQNHPLPPCSSQQSGHPQPDAPQSHALLQHYALQSLSPQIAGQGMSASNDTISEEFRDLVRACEGDISEATARFQSEYEINGNDMVAAVRSALGRRLRGL